jgi:Domain of unknown function (DUF4352)
MNSDRPRNPRRAHRRSRDHRRSVRHWSGHDRHTAQPGSSVSQAPSQKPEASQPPTVKIGEKVTDDSYQFTGTKVTCGVRQVGDQYANEKAQGQFCMVRMRVKNVGKDPITFSDENQALLDTKGRQYSPDDAAWIYLDAAPSP